MVLQLLTSAFQTVRLIISARSKKEQADTLSVHRKQKPESSRKHGGHRTAEAAEIHTILEFCGFGVDADCINIAQDGLESFADMLSFAKKDIGSLAKGFQKGEQCAEEGQKLWLASNQSPQGSNPLGSRLPTHQQERCSWSSA
jgi:hypothetical protein